MANAWNDERMTAEQRAYEHYKAFCGSLQIKPASEATYLKETETLNKYPNQMPKRTNHHHPAKEQ